MNTTDQNQNFTSQSNPASSANGYGSPAAPLPADEIESLLRLARRNLGQSMPLETAEELGPGDVQHFRGSSNSEEGQADVSTTGHNQFNELPNFGPIGTGQNLENLADRSPHPSKPANGLTLEDLGDVDLEVSIELGRTEILIEDILKLREGSVVALDRLAGDPVDIVANGRLVARGELLVIEGKFGVRLSEVL